MSVVQSEQFKTERKLVAMDAIQPILRNSSDITSAEFREFLQYKNSLYSRQRLYKNFTDADGNFTIYEKGTKQDKDALNALSKDIHDYEAKMTKTPIFDMLVKEMNSIDNAELPKFLRDESGRWAEAEVLKGWYQNSRGDLYHYDGVIWDEVPNEQIKDLEFLGE